VSIILQNESGALICLNHCHENKNNFLICIISFDYICLRYLCYNFYIYSINADVVLTELSLPREMSMLIVNNADS